MGATRCRGGVIDRAQDGHPFPAGFLPQGQAGPGGGWRAASRALGPTEAWLEGIPPGKIAHFAGEARVTDVVDPRKVLDEDKRLTLIVSLLQTVRTGVRDDVVTMFCKRIATIRKKGRDQFAP
jgi:hypothetical protein